MINKNKNYQKIKEIFVLNYLLPSLRKKIALIKIINWWKNLIKGYFSIKIYSYKSWFNEMEKEIYYCYNRNKNIYRIMLSYNSNEDKLEYKLIFYFNNNINKNINNLLLELKDEFTYIYSFYSIIFEVNFNVKLIKLKLNNKIYYNFYIEDEEDKIINNSINEDFVKKIIKKLRDI